MKKYFVYLASAALMLACNKAEIEAPVDNTPVDTPVETELITVELSPMTKTALGAEGSTTWSAGDAVSVTVGGEVVGTLTLVEGSTFQGEIVAGLAGDAEAVLNYPAGVDEVPATQVATDGTFANGAALLEATTTVEALRAGTDIEMKNQTALLCFSVAQAGDVTFEVGNTTYTVTGCNTGATYYACVDPAENVSFTARIDGYLSRAASKNVTFTASKIANLETLPAPKVSSWGLIGVGGDWNNDIKMYEDVDGYSVVKGVTIQSTDEFKFRVGNWTSEISGGLTAPNTERSNNTTVKANITVSEAGVYDIYTNGKKYYIMTPGNLPAAATDPTPITITIKSTDTAYKCLHLWSGSTGILSCKYNANSTWTAAIPVDLLDQKFKAILTKGSSDNNWTSQTNDSDDLCLRNPMELTVVSNKATHK